MRPLLPLSVAVVLVGCNAVPGTPRVGIDPDFPTTVDDLSLVIERAAEDEDPDSLIYRTVWTRNGFDVDELQGELTVPAQWTTKGELWGVEVIAFDGVNEGEVVDAEVVVQNSQPTLSVALPTEDVPGDQDLELQVDAFDADDDELEITYSWSVDGVDADIDGPVVPAARTERSQVWSVLVGATDGDSEPVFADASVTIANAPPVVRNVQLAPAPLRTLDNLSLTFSASDDDGDPVTVDLSWTLNGAPLDVAGQVVSAAQYVRGDEIRVALTPNDGAIDGDTVFAAAVVDNTPPRVRSAVVSPARLDETVTATCQPSGWVDPDGDDEGYFTTWIINGTAASVGETLTGADFDRGDTVACELVPFDGIDEGEAVTSPEVTVGNAAPTLASVSVTPTLAYETSTLTAQLGATQDLDGDEVSAIVNWDVNGRTVRKQQLTGVDFDKGDTVRAVVTPTDGQSNGVAVRSAPITIENSAPVMVSVSLDKTAATVEDSLTAQWSATDADGDTLTPTFTWFVNTGTSSVTGATLDGDDFVKGDTIYASVTVSDGDDTSGSLSSASLTIDNAVPTAPEVAIDPSAARTDDDLFCEITTDATDADGDAISYDFEWTRNGTVMTGFFKTTDYTGDTVAAGRTSDGDEWTCTVTADDGEDTSEGTDTVSVGGLKILWIWDAKTTAANTFINAVEAAGHEIDYATGDTGSWNGSNPSLTGYDVVLYTPGDTFGRWPSSTAQATLESWVKGGGGLVTTGWTGYQYSSRRGLNSMADVVLVTYAGALSSGYSMSPTSGNSSHPVAAAFSTARSKPTCSISEDTARTGTTVRVAATRSGYTTYAYAVTDTVGSGRVVSLAHTADYSTTSCWSESWVRESTIDALEWAGGL